jgi:hypothetical protein
MRSTRGHEFDVPQGAEEASGAEDLTRVGSKGGADLT